MKTTKEPLIGGRIIETLDLLIKIQNKGIATIFMNVSGHCNGIDFSIHAPQWKDGKSSDYSERLYDLTENERFDEIHETLRNILKNGESAIPGIESKRLAEKERKQRLLQELMEEFREVANPLR